tara:strand:- start:8846 stop:9769 length:924 start_codon:yes stop_codon:yes gene_type:complete
LSVFKYQANQNKVYRNYINALGIDSSSVNSLQQIPFLPISFFKSHEVKCGSFESEITFESSGTTGQVRSKHAIKNREIYIKSFSKAFEQFYGNPKEYLILALLPSYLERQNSSLVFMANHLIQQSDFEESGFFLKDTDKLIATLKQAASKKQKTILLGVSFALLDLVEQYVIPKNPNLVVMETGGMKGKRKELIREELHAILKSGFHCDSIHSEYGMTELLSQAYASKNGQFSCPPWMRVLIRKQDNPFEYTQTNEVGAINIIDLANIYSCSFIQTDDLGKMQADGKFEVLGRFDQAEVRGCNLLVT